LEAIVHWDDNKPNPPARVDTGASTSNMANSENCFFKLFLELDFAFTKQASLKQITFEF
jgi:hypothetical protein